MENRQSNSPTTAIMELANMISVPMALNAVVRLNVADAIWQGGSNKPLSAAEILSSAALGPGGDADNLQRILRLLTSFGVFEEHLNADATERRYSLTEVGKSLATDESGLSYGAYVLQHHQDALMRAWTLVHEAVLDPSSEPFVKANGEGAYSYYGKKPEMNDLMLKAMSGVSVPFMKAFLNGYDGFQGVRTLVDVGGSAGDCLRMIMSKNPSIRKGIEHVGGDLLKTIPPADAIFMKWILTTWTDDECKHILKNCHDALPLGGKVVACEPVLPNHTDNSHRSRALLAGDIFVMTIYRSKGKHRTEMEYRELGFAAGFRNFKAKILLDQFYTVLEFQK
ncbi:UNVERIFIED_CONTAM: Caffeic acid 3-O-methyltransferase [Sesamum radiatum]|uniref:Caffeic acid 3-O-methyltransferase n=1 Tax=Sesamum radiatum TaxID=300843 RepID=A0AAW2NL85_SESRA